MNKSIIIIACYLIMAGILPYLLITNRITLKKMGECLLKLPRKSSVGVIIIDIIALIIPAILLIRDFRSLNFIFAACSLLAFFIMTKDGFNRKNYGVYQKGIIAPSAIIFYDDILGFPVFEQGLTAVGDGDFYQHAGAQVAAPPLVLETVVHIGIGHGEGAHEGYGGHHVGTHYFGFLLEDFAGQREAAGLRT